MNDCDLVRQKLALTAECCRTCHEIDQAECGDDLCEIAVQGDSYRVCCGVQAAAFYPQLVNQHDRADQISPRKMMR